MSASMMPPLMSIAPAAQANPAVRWGEPWILTLLFPQTVGEDAAFIGVQMGAVTQADTG